MSVKHLIPFLALIVAGFADVAWAQNQLTYTTNNSVITITGYTGDTDSVTNVVIPATIDTYPVTSIDSYAFEVCTSLTNVTIPNSVTNIGTYAFYYCPSLTNMAIPSSAITIGLLAFGACPNLTNILVDAANPAYSSFNGALLDKAQATLIQCPGGVASYTIPGSVTNIGISAFQECNQLTAVTIPNNVLSIQDYAFFSSFSLMNVMIPASVISIAGNAFGNCTSLTNFTVDAANPVYSSLNGVVFDKSQTTLLIFPNGFGGSYAVPAGVSSIVNGAFQLSGNLAEVTIPASVANIGGGAFDLCASLTNITVAVANPAYSSINGVLFDKAQVTLVAFPNGLTGNYAIPGSVSSVGTEAFIHCSLASVTMSNTVNSIGYQAFFNCSYLRSVTIGAGVKSIGSEAFNSCVSLTNLTFLGNAPALGNSVLAGEPSGATVYYYYGTSGWSATYGGLPTVGLRATTNPPPGNDLNYVNSNGSILVLDYVGATSNVTNVVIPGIINGYPVVGFFNGAFEGCTNMTNLYIADGITNIGFGTFAGCTGLTSVTIPYGAVSAGADTFYGCTGLTNVTIRDGIVAIGESVFAYCTGLRSVTIPASVAIIADDAFQYCSGLTNLTFLGNAPTLGGSPISGWPDGAKVYYYYGTSGWNSTFDGLPTVELFPPPQIGGGGTNGGGKARIQMDGNFGFGIGGVSGQTITIETSTNLVNWQAIQTMHLSGTATNFIDPQWTNYPGRFYRVK